MIHTFLAIGKQKTKLKNKIFGRAGESRTHSVWRPHVLSVLRKPFRHGPKEFGGCRLIRTGNASKEICVYGAVRPTNIRVTPNGREHESRTHSSCYGVGALAVRWLTVCLALGELLAGGGRIELHWLITSPRFSGPLGDQSPAPPVCQRTKTWWPRRDLHSQSRRRWFLRPVRMHSATEPWSTEWESNPSNQLCRLTPSRLVFSA